MQPRWHLLNEACGKSAVNIFFAGAGITYDFGYEAGIRKRLLSCHSNSQEDIEGFIEGQKAGKESFGIIDSGAFTVWNKGGHIDVDEYGDRLLVLLQNFDVAANLDVIPGKQGMDAKHIETATTEKAADGGWRNYLNLTAKLQEYDIDWRRLMPIYHQGESLDWLKRMVDHGCTYIGISPSNDYHTNQRSLWLDDVYDYLRKLPVLPKTHGYAVTSPVLMRQYPWFSVDSSSWIQLGGYGCVNTPYGMVILSEREDVMGRPDSMDGRNWSPEMKEKITKYFTSHGLTIDGLKKSYYERWKANVIYLLDYEKNFKYRPRLRGGSLFDEMPTLNVAPTPHKSEPKVKQDFFGLALDPDLLKGDGPMSLFDAQI